MRKYLIFSLICLIPELFSNDFKVAVVDIDKIFKEYYRAKIAKANIQKQMEIFKISAGKLIASKDKLKEEFKEAQNASQNIVLSDSERENKHREAKKIYVQLQEKEAELVKYVKEKQEQLKTQEEENYSNLLAEIKKEIAKKTASGGYTLVLDKSEKSFNNIVQNDPSIDITSSVLEELNRGHKTKKKD